MEQNEQSTNNTVQETPIVEAVSAVDAPVNKPSRAALWLLGAVVIIIIILVATSKGGYDATEQGPTVSNVQETACFYGTATTSSGIKSAYSLKLDIDGDNATGELATAPAEKDKMKATLSGQIIPGNNERIFDGTEESTQEGVKNSGERIIRFSATSALIGYGQTVENIDGTYSYADVNAINYSLTIPRVACENYQTAF